MSTATAPDHQEQQHGLPARLMRLDGLRGLAAAGVTFHHLFFHMLPPLHAPAPIRWISDWLWHRGWTLVDLFFLLSGYVFAHVYLGSPAALRTRASQASFWTGRFARLYPLHLVTLVGFAVFARHNPANTGWAFLGHLLMLQGFVSPVAQSFDNASWSLTMEVVCYALFAAGCALGDGVLARASTILVVLSAWFLLLFGPPGGPWVGDALPRGIMGFFLGQLLWRQRARLAQIPGAVFIAIAVAGLWMQTGAYSPLLPLGLLTWPAVLLLSLRLAIMEHPVMLWLGERSYGIYLLNMAVVRIALAWWPMEHLSGMQQAMVMAAGLTAILLMSDVSYRWVEVPARRMIRGSLKAWGARFAMRDHQAAGVNV